MTSNMNTVFPNNNSPFRTSKFDFPLKLHDLLDSVTGTDHERIVSWDRDHGKAFRIFDRKAFEKYIMPSFFPGQTQYKSFIRQLNIYGFTRVRDPTSRYHSYYQHPYFLRGQLGLCNSMQRIKTKGPKAPIRAIRGKTGLDISPTAGTTTNEAYDSFPGEDDARVFCLLYNDIFGKESDNPFISSDGGRRSRAEMRRASPSTGQGMPSNVLESSTMEAIDRFTGGPGSDLPGLWHCQNDSSTPECLEEEVVEAGYLLTVEPTPLRVEVPQRLAGTTNTHFRFLSN